MKLVASPVLEEMDIEALRLGTEEPSTILQRVALRGLTNIEDLLNRERMNALAWLIAKGCLQVRLAVRLNTKEEPSRGIYHEKMGIFSDAEGNHVAFSGSSNETAGGLVDNFESIDVFWSWDDSHGRVQRKIDDFEALWSNRTEGVRVYEFTEISEKLLARYRLSTPPHVEEGATNGAGKLEANPAIPADLELRKHQRAALNAWKTNNFHGILSMATGTGKTLTALYGACKIAEKVEPLALIVVCPYINLAEQWCREMTRFGLDPIRCYRSRALWLDVLQNGFTSLALRKTKLLPIVVTNRTFLSEEFQALLRPSDIPHLLIADEVHNLGAERIQRYLSQDFRFRLGLSATPERHRDEEGTGVILDYFGGIVFEYGIKEAIADDILCRYRYYPVVVDLTEKEGEEYWRLTREIGRRMPRTEGEQFSNPLKMLLIQRARVQASAANKLPALSTLLREMGQPVQKALIYCGDGRVEDEERDDIDVSRQVDAAVRLVGANCELRVRRFTCAEPMSEREDILAQLRDGKLNALVAIRCLDEGIDVPNVRMAFILASSTNPRQFIQRRGRLLRKAKGKIRAEIWDFIIRPPDLGGQTDASTFNLERRLFSRELARVIEFCQTAENGDEALNLPWLQDLRRRYNLVSQ